MGGHVKIYLPTGVIGRAVLMTQTFGLDWAARKNVKHAFRRAELPISYRSSPMVLLWWRMTLLSACNLV